MWSVAHAGARATLGIAVLAAGIAGATASARAIECREDYQVVAGQLLSTPYCQDGYLARVARQYGSRVTAAQIRNNPHTKADVCRFMGHDSHVSHICQDYRATPRGFGR